MFFLVWRCVPPLWVKKSRYLLTGKVCNNHAGVRAGFSVYVGVGRFGRSISTQVLLFCSVSEESQMGSNLICPLEIFTQKKYPSWVCQVKMSPSWRAGRIGDESGRPQSVPTINDKRRTFLWLVSRSRGVRKGNGKSTPRKTNMTLENPQFQ